MFDFTFLPTLNASLNAVAAGLLLLGYAAVRRCRVTLHKTCMVSAFVASVLFLASYVTYHVLRQMREGVGHTRFEGPAAIAPLYYGLLISHVLLAAVVPVLAILVLRHALRGDLARHRRLARWTLPIWLYVSATGVLIYLMLYHRAAVLAS
jgi:uncharacterized membrane protein YozB (DUF420 family)